VIRLSSLLWNNKYDGREGIPMNTSGVHIHLYSIHGLIRGKNLELGRDADTGGQVKYLIELAQSLGKHDGARKVTLYSGKNIFDSIKI
jgi:sucrose-phosphate synthase